jgi:hypothetical protein
VSVHEVDVRMSLGKRVPLGRVQETLERRCTMYFVQPVPDKCNVFITEVRHGARRRRNGGRPGGGCARRPVGTYLYLHAVSVGNHVAVPCLAR